MSLAESPKRAGLLYAGTDDGNLQVTRDGGKTWTQRLPTSCQDAPKGIYVSRGGAVALRRGHRLRDLRRPPQNDYETYIYASNDFGQTWTSIERQPEG